MRGKHHEYFPALKYDWLTPLYDPLLRWTLRESIFKRHLMEQAGIERDHRVLDLGCGMATLMIQIKRAHPEAEVVGIDVDLKIAEITISLRGQAGDT